MIALLLLAAASASAIPAISNEFSAHVTNHEADGTVYATEDLYLSLSGGMDRTDINFTLTKPEQWSTGIMLKTPTAKLNDFNVFELGGAFGAAPQCQEMKAQVQMNPFWDMPTNATLADKAVKINGVTCQRWSYYVLGSLFNLFVTESGTPCRVQCVTPNPSTPGKPWHADYSNFVGRAPSASLFTPDAVSKGIKCVPKQPPAKASRKARRRSAHTRPVHPATGGSVAVTEQLIPVNKKALKSAPLCKPCMDVFNAEMSSVLNMVAQAGVAGSCGKLCSLMPHPAEASICTAVCVYAGLKEFTKVIENTDLNPFNLCTQMKVCPAASCVGTEAKPCAKVNSVVVSPNPAVLQETVTITANYTVEAGVGSLGTGQVRLLLDGPFGGGFAEMGQMIITEDPTPGTHIVSFPLNTHNLRSWYPGSYMVEVDICSEDCENQHGEIYDMFFGPNMNMTAKP